MTNPNHYRNKNQIVFGFDDKRRIVSGFYEEFTHKIVNFETCYVQDEISDNIVKTIKDLFLKMHIMPYDEKYISEFTDSFGASLKSISMRAEAMGYILVATNLTGSNAFFVRKDLAGEHFYKAGDVATLYNPARYYLRFYSGHPVGKVKIS